MVNGKYGPYLPEEKQFRHENFYPALVSKTDWLAAQAELARRNGKKMPQGNNRPKHRYAGLLRCADCGAVFIPQNRWWNGKCRVEYVCKTYMDHGKAHCTSHRIHEEALDAAAAGEIAALRDRLRGEEAELIRRRRASEQTEESQETACRAEYRIGAHAGRGDNAARSDCVHPYQTGSKRGMRVNGMENGRLIFLSLPLVRVVGVEPTRISPQEPKSCTSANSAIPAWKFWALPQSAAYRMPVLFLAGNR